MTRHGYPHAEATLLQRLRGFPGKLRRHGEKIVHTRASFGLHVEGWNSQRAHGADRLSTDVSFVLVCTR